MKLRPLIISFSLAAILLLGLALWYFQPPTPAAAPLAQAKPVAPAPVAQSEISSAGQGSAPALAPVTSAPISAPAPAAIAQLPAPAAPPAPSASALQPFSSSALPSPEPQAREEAATARMYAAHAPLRTPEVADPDSAANKRVLSTMVAKALARPATPPPALSPSNGPASHPETSAR